MTFEFTSFSKKPSRIFGRKTMALVDVDVRANGIRIAPPTRQKDIAEDQGANCCRFVLGNIAGLANSGGADVSRPDRSFCRNALAQEAGQRSPEISGADLAAAY